MNKRRFNQLCAAMLFGLASVLLGTAGCETGVDPNPLPNPGDPADPGAGVGDPIGPDLAGVWRRESGRLFSFAEEQLEYLVLDEDGSIRASVRNQSTNILECRNGLYARVTDDAMVMSFDAGPNVQSIAGSGLMLFEMPDADTLYLMDRDEMTTFVREAEWPEVSQCKQPVVEQIFEDLAVRPSFDSGLAYDGTSLWFRDDFGMIYPIDPESGELGMPVNLTRSENVQAAQADDFWGVCQCGAGLVERRTKQDVLVDYVTETELGVDFRAQSAAFDKTGKVLWIFGQEGVERRRGFLKVDAEPLDPMPNELLEHVEFDTHLNGIAANGAFLWAIYHRSIVKIDTQTYQSVATYTLQGDYVDWYGIAVVGNYLYVIGENYELGTGVLMKVAK